MLPLTAVQVPAVYARFRCCESQGLLHQDMYANDPPNFICPPGATFMDDQSALMLREVAPLYFTLYDEPCLAPSVNPRVREGIVRLCKPEAHLIDAPNVMSECYMTVALEMRKVRFIGMPLHWQPL